MPRTSTAAALVLSDRTVGRHIENVYATIGARRRADAATYAQRHGLHHPDAPASSPPLSATSGSGGPNYPYGGPFPVCLPTEQDGSFSR